MYVPHCLRPILDELTTKQKNFNKKNDYVVELPVFSVIKPGVAVFFFLKLGTNEISGADYIASISDTLSEYNLDPCV